MLQDSYSHPKTFSFSWRCLGVTYIPNLRFHRFSVATTCLSVCVWGLTKLFHMISKSHSCLWPVIDNVPQFFLLFDLCLDKSAPIYQFRLSFCTSELMKPYVSYVYRSVCVTLLFCLSCQVRSHAYSQKKSWKRLPHVFVDCSKNFLCVRGIPLVLLGVAPWAL